MFPAPFTPSDKVQGKNQEKRSNLNFYKISVSPLFGLLGGGFVCFFNSLEESAKDGDQKGKIIYYPHFGRRDRRRGYHFLNANLYWKWALYFKGVRYPLGNLVNFQLGGRCASKQVIGNFTLPNTDGINYPLRSVSLAVVCGGNLKNQWWPDM